MPSFLQRVRNFLGRVVGQVGTAGQQLPTPTVEEQPPPQHPPSRQPPTPEPEPIETDNEVRYIDGRKDTGKPRIYSRWEVGDSDLEPGTQGLMDMVRQSGRRRKVSIVVEGDFVDPYDDGSISGWKSYSFHIADVMREARRYKTARGAINALIAKTHRDEYAEVRTIQVLDSPEYF